MNLEKYRQLFFDETSEELNSIENFILKIKETPSDTEILKSIFRLFHRLKSSSAMMGLTNFSELSHRAEDLLSRINDGEIRVGESIVNTLLSVIDTMRSLIREAESGNTAGDRPDDLLGQLKNMCADMSRTNTAPEAKIKDPSQANATPATTLPNKNDVKVEGDKIHHGLNVIRIDEAELNDLIDMAGELISTISELDKAVDILDQNSSVKEKETANHAIINIKHKAEKLSIDMHTKLLRSKMVPTGEMFERLKRTIHDLSVKTNKCIQVLINTDEIDLDRAVIDKLFNPLLHIVRNAVDHGIEGDEERRESGKSPIANITLSAVLQGHYVIISVEDDGKGVDLEKAKRAILKRNVLDEEGIANITEKEIIDYLFLPGFSTKDSATEISGRGMGLDIVRENVKDIKGTVEINTLKGRGTTVRITIPQTLSIIRCLQIFVGSKIYSIPSESILEIIPYNPETFMTAQGMPLLLYRGSPISIVDMDRALNIHCENQSVTAYIIIGNMDARIAIPANNIMSEHDILIKHLGQTFSMVVGILGVGILSGGRLSLILDTDFLLRQYMPREGASRSYPRQLTDEGGGNTHLTLNSIKGIINGSVSS